MDETTIQEAVNAVEKEVVIPKKEKKVKENFVSKEEFDTLKQDMNKSFQQIVDLIKDKPSGAKVDATKRVESEKKIDEANSDMSDFNQRYDSKAKEILGDKIERTFITYPKGGGTLFTIVIKREHSNSPKDYLERYKEDKRTVNLEREEFRGESGVEAWAKLILANLNRTSR